MNEEGRSYSVPGGAGNRESWLPRTGDTGDERGRSGRAVCVSRVGVCGAFPDEMVEGLRKAPVLIFNAQKDKTFNVDRVREQKQKLAAAAGEVKLHEVPGGRGGYGNLQSYALLLDWFDAHRGTPEGQAPPKREDED